jgi:hypothetical protein
VAGNETLKPNCGNPPAVQGRNKKYAALLKEYHKAVSAMIESVKPELSDIAVGLGVKRRRRYKNRLKALRLAARELTNTFRR